MNLRRLLFVGLSATLLLASPALAGQGTLMDVLFPAKADKAEAKEGGAKTKLSAKEKAKGKLAAKSLGAKSKDKLAAKDRPLAKAAPKRASPKDAVTEVAAARPGRRLPGVGIGQAPEETTEAEVVLAGNNGELRSLPRQQRQGLFASLFGGREEGPRMLPQTQALDRVLAQKESKKKFQVKDAFVPQEVEFSGYAPGTVVIDTKTRFLYLVENSSTARRYAIAVGREGLLFTGRATIGDKQEWPRWIPTLDMQKREPKKYGVWKDGMPGGPENPLGARAIYLFQGRADTHIRIHGTNQPQSIGTAASNGCFRMVNEHVIDLYNRVPMGAPVVVL